MRFILLDRITSFVPGRSGTAFKNVSLSEDFFEDHFPLAPVMPGVLIMEGMAQLAGLILEAGCHERDGRKVKPLLSIIESAKFRARTRPGDCLEYRATVDSSNDFPPQAVRGLTNTGTPLTVLSAASLSV